MVFSADAQGSAGIEADHVRFASLYKIGGIAKWFWGEINER